MSTIKNLLMFFAAVLGLIASGLTIVYWSIMGFLTGFTATGSAIREIHENDLSVGRNMNTMGMDEFTCVMKTESILSTTCSNGYAKAPHARKYAEALEKIRDKEHQL